MIPFYRICGINYDVATWTPLLIHIYQRNVSECMKSSFQDIYAHHQQVTEGHGIGYLLL